MASDVSKYRLMPPSQTTKKNKYPVESCRSFMREVSNAGFGELVNDGETSKRDHTQTWENLKKKQ